MEERVGGVGAHRVSWEPIFLVDAHPEWECGGDTIGLLVEEIPPASNSLGQQDTWHEDIGPLEKVDLVPPSIEQFGEHEANERPMDRKTTIGDVDHRPEIPPESIPLEYHVVQTCTNDAEKEHEKQLIPNLIRMVPTMGSSCEREPRSKRRSSRNDRPIPADRDGNAGGDEERITWGN